MEESHPQSPTPPPSQGAAPIADLEWEEYDPQTHPASFTFFHHCLAGSFAGVAEHTLLYPLDTVKTCWQSQVLNNAATNGAVSHSANVTQTAQVGGVADACKPCKVHQTISKFSIPKATTRAATAAWNPSHASSPLSQAVMSATSKPSLPQQPAAQSALHATHAAHAANHPHTPQHPPQQQGIWSTMKHLMHNGHGGHGAHHANHHPLELQRGVYTLAQHAQYPAHPTSDAASTLESSAKSSARSARTEGVKRLFRGVQTMFVGCIPAHALYFSSYEMVKHVCYQQNQQNHHGQTTTHTTHTTHPNTLSPTQAMMAGTIATLLHDFIMTPMDTMKQRMQLGHYGGLRDAFASIVWGDVKPVQGGVAGGAGATGVTGMAGVAGVRTGGEGWKGLYRSFPITVMTNVPYGMIMMTTNEWLRGVLEDGLYGNRNLSGGVNGANEDDENRPFHFATILLSGMGAGTVAAAATAPLDRVKTRLQTQRMGMVLPGTGNHSGGAGGAVMEIMEERAVAAAKGERKQCPKMVAQDVQRALNGTYQATHHTPPNTAANAIQTLRQTPFTKTYYTTPLDAFKSIIQEEGYRGLFRGTVPRVALHAPSVAISWTAYEMAKGWLVWLVD